MKLRLILLTLLVSSTALAQLQDQASCTDTDIRETNPNIKNNPEMIEHFSTPRNQDSIGWCYAFTAADLMSAEVGVPLSSIHASTVYNKKIQNNFFLRLGYRIGKIFNRSSYLDDVYEGGFASWALKEMMKNKQVCAEKDLPFDYSHPYETLLLIRQLEELKDMVKAKELVQEQLCQEVESTLQEFNLVSADAEAIAASLLNENMNLTMEKLSGEACKDKMVEIPKLKVESKGVPDISNTKKTKKFLETLNSVLDRGRPVEFSYNVKHFTRDKGQHSSIVMARRWKNGRCEYRVRNSWGRTCAAYDEGIDCDFGTGTFWVSDEEFIKAAGRINYIK